MEKTYKTALLVVDLQKDFTMPWGSVYREPVGEMMDRVSENIDKLREKGVLIVIVYSGGPAKKEMHARSSASRILDDKGDRRCLIEGTPGFELDDRIHIDVNNDIMWKKKAASAFFKTNLDEVLRAKGVENVLVCGTKTNVCCRATVNDAHTHEFRTFIIRDMTATNTPELHDFFCDDMNKYLATAITSEQMFQRLEAGDL